MYTSWQFHEFTIPQVDISKSWRFYKLTIPLTTSQFHGMSIRIRVYNSTSWQLREFAK